MSRSQLQAAAAQSCCTSQGNGTEHASRSPPIPEARKLEYFSILAYLWTLIHHGGLLLTQLHFQLAFRESFWQSHAGCRTPSVGAGIVRSHSSHNTPCPFHPAWNMEVLSGVPAATLDHKANGIGSYTLKMEEQQKPRNQK